MCICLNDTLCDCVDFHYSGDFFFTLILAAVFMYVAFYIYFKFYPIDEDGKQ